MAGVRPASSPSLLSYRLCLLVPLYRRQRGGIAVLALSHPFDPAAPLKPVVQELAVQASCRSVSGGEPACESWCKHMLSRVQGFAVLLTLPIVAGSDLLAAEEGIFFAG